MDVNRAPAPSLAPSPSPLSTEGGPTAWRTVIASAFGLAFGPSVMIVLAFGAFVAPLEAEFGWGVAAITLGGSVISVMIMLVTPLQGFLVDRLGARRLVLWSIPAFSLSLMAMALLPDNIVVFYLAGVIIPICGLGVWPVSYLRATAGWFDRRLGLALGLANAGIGVGSVVVPLTTAVLIAAFGWRTAFLGLGVVALLALPIAFAFLTEATSKRHSDVGTREAPDGDTLSSAASGRTFWIVAAAVFLLGAVSASIIFHQVRLLIDAGIPRETATFIPVAMGVALIAARVGTGWLLDRVSVRAVMVIALTGGGVATLIYASQPGLPLAIVAAVLAGLLIGAEFDVLSYLVPRYFGRRSFGRLYGALFAVFQLGSAITAAAVGLSRGALGSYTPAMLGLCGVCLVSALLFSVLGPYRHGVATPRETVPDTAQ